MSGSVIGIFTAGVRGGAIAARREVHAVAGRGLEGDRNFTGDGDEPDPTEEITLIEAEALRRAAAEHGVDLEPGEHRRNVVVDGLALLPLVGQKIHVGQAEVEVLEDNPPCGYLQRLTGKPVVTALQGMGGVRGRIVTSGLIRIGDPVQA
jgi:MOSC domain-containing protein YiiM